MVNRVLVWGFRELLLSRSTSLKSAHRFVVGDLRKKALEFGASGMRVIPLPQTAEAAPRR
jgi:hypothetical protein